MPADDVDAGKVSVSLGFDLDDRGFHEWNRQRQQAEKARKISQELTIDYDRTDAERNIREFERNLDDIDKRNARRAAFYAAYPERSRRELSQAFNKMLRDERAAAKDAERQRAETVKAIDQMNADLARQQQRRDKEIRDAAARRAREEVRDRERQVAEMARIEDQAYREDARRTKQHRDRMARLEAQAYAEDIRRQRAALRDQEREEQRSLRDRERRIIAFGRGIGDAIPNLNFSTRIPVWGILGFTAAVQGALPPVIALAGSIGELGGWLAALPGLAAAAGGGLLAATLGLRGVGDALGAAWEAQLSAAEDGVDAAQRQEAAADQVRSAERSLKDALEARTDAQEAVNEATADATRELRDMRIEARAANATEQERVERLREAREELGRLRAEGAGQREIAAAQREVTFAEVELARTRARNRDDAEALAEAEQQGVRRMPQVVAARERLADSEQAVADAQRQVDRANRDAARSMTEASGGADKLQEKLADLSPAGREFVLLVQDRFFPLFRRLRDTAQEGLLPGLGTGLVEAERNFPVLERMVGRYADALGDAAVKQGELFGSRAQGRDMEQIFGQGERLIRRSADAAIDWERGLTHVAVAADPLLDWAGEMNVELADMFETWAEGGRETGRFERFFQRTIQATKDVVGTLWDFGAALIDIGGVGARVWGDDLRGGIRDAAREFREWTESVRGQRSLEEWFRRWRDRWGDIKDAITEVIREYQLLRRRGASATEALTTVIVDSFAELIPTLVEEIAVRMPDLVAGFIRGFLRADLWGKLAVGAWLVSRFGGVRAFAAIGRQLAVPLAAAFASRLMTFGVIERFATWMLGPARVDKIRKSGRSLGRLWGIGFAAGFALMLPDIYNKLEEVIDPDFGKARSPEEHEAEFGRRPGEYSPEEQRRNQLGLNPMKGPEVDERAFRKVTRAWRDLRRDIQRDAGDIERIADRNFKRIARTMGVETKDGRELAERNFHEAAQAISRRVRDGEISTRQGMRSINRLVKTHSEGANEETRKNFDAMGRKVNRRMAKAAKDTDTHMTSLRGAVETGIGGAAGFLNQTLKDMGLKPMKFTAKGVTIGGKRVPELVDPQELLGEDHASGGFVGRLAGLFAGGGLVGRWGERGRDMVHAILGRGEAVLNHYQQKIVNTALRLVGVRGLPDLFRRTRGTKHYMAEGGHAGGDGGSIVDHYPQAFAGGGYPMVTGDTDFVPALGHALSRMAKATGRPIYVQDGRRTLAEQQHLYNLYLSGRGNLAAAPTPNAPHIRGIAGDITPGREVFGGIANRFGLGFTVPSESWHIELLNAAGSALAGIAARIPGIEIDGPPGPLRRLAQALVNRFRKGAQRKLDDLSMTSPSSSRGLDPSQFDGGGDSAANIALGRRMAAKYGWTGGEWDALLELWMRESGWQTTADNPTSDAYGIPQALPGSKMASAGSDWMTNPATQIAWGLGYIQDRYGSPSGALSFHDANNWYGGGGFAGLPFVGGFDGGGFVGGAGMLTGRGKRRTGKWRRIVNRLEGEIEGLGSRYDLDSRWADLTAEEFIVEGDEDTPPSLDQEAIDRRVRELDGLIRTRRQIAMKYKRMADYIEKLVNVYNRMRERLEKSIARVRKNLDRLKGRKGKEARRSRKKKEQQLDSFTGALRGAREQLAELRPRHSDALYEWESSRIDLQELRDERAPLLGGGRGLELPDWEPSDSTDRSADEDAQRAQLEQRLAAAEEFRRISQGAFSVFQGPGDIGAGAQYALRAAANPQGTPEGPGPGLGLEMRDDGRIYQIGGNTPVDPGSLTRGEGFAPQIQQNIYTLHPGDPATLAAIGSAATRGQSMQGAVPANRRTIDV